MTDAHDALTLALDLPGRERKDVDVSIVDGGRFVELRAPAVPAAGGRRARPALHARVALPATASAAEATASAPARGPALLDFARTAARMAAGELVVRIPKLPPPPPPQAWRVPVLSDDDEEGPAAVAGDRPAPAEPAARAAVRPPPSAAAAASDDEDGSWVEASSSDDEEAEAEGRTARRKAKGGPSSGAVLEAVDGEE
jgi:hypothetical protein